MSAKRPKRNLSARTRKKRGTRNCTSPPHAARWASLLGFAGLLMWAAAGVWFVHHPPRWIESKAQTSPLLTHILCAIGNPLGDLTDSLAWTGHDAVYEYDEEAPAGQVLFAGAPVRTGAPAPDDIQILDRGEFLVGWSPKLRHPVWVAYHVPREARYEVGKRPSFLRDKSVPNCPLSGAYDHSGYDRGHMAPNYAIATRFGPQAQRKTFLMSNISPQSPPLNRGVWREVEHRIADFWTARWGEIWVVVGSVSDSYEKLPGTDIDVPSQYYAVVVCQEGLNIRAFALLFGQHVPWRCWPTRNLITIDELEERTGLDFLPDLPDFIQRPLEAELPSRLLPMRPLDALKTIGLRLKCY